LPVVRDQRQQPADGDGSQAGDGHRKGHGRTGLLAYIVTSKFSDYLPLYRLEDIFERQGFEISRATQ
jgi:transposase